MSRDVQAVPMDWPAWYAADCPQTGPRGECGMMPPEVDTTGDHMMLACPGCGSYSPFRVGRTKPEPPPVWKVVSGSVEDVPSLTLEPSILRGCCGWHGHLRQGVFRAV